jgi:hypothetical protein
MTSKVTMALAGLAVASLPVLVGAQTTSTPQTRPEQPTTTSPQTRSGRTADLNSPQHHLDEAKRVLTSIDANSAQGETRSKVTELKRHFTQLEASWRANTAGAARTGASRSTETPAATASTSGTTQGTAGTTATTPEQTGTSGSQGRYPRNTSNDWMTHYTAINTLLDQMIGSGASADAAMSGSAGTTAGTAAGTTGSTSERTGTTAKPRASASAGVKVEGDVRTKLVEFKRHLDQFHTTAMAQRAPGGEDASAASRMTSPPATTSHETPEATTATGTTGTMTGTSGTSGTTASGTTAGATVQNPQTAQTPSSAQTAQQTSASAAVDSAAIARLTASIDEMLRGGAATSAAAGTTTSATGTTAVGTSGTTSATGTVCVDRAKLEELKTQLQALQNRPR